MNVTKDFVIGILAYIKYNYLQDLLDDINRQTIWPKEVIISDNGDGFHLNKKYHFPITIVKNSYNYGTTRGLNQILKLCNNKENILLLCDDNFFIEDNSLEKIYNKFEYENKVNNIHILWLCHWASILISKKWIEDFGYFDENLWPCYYEDSDCVERIRKKKNTVLCNGIGWPLETLPMTGSASEFIGNRHATCSQVTNVKYGDTVSRTCAYYMTKWKKEDVINNDEIIAIHDNTKDYYVDSHDVDFYKCHIDFLKNVIKNYKISNNASKISAFIDDVLTLKEFNFEKIIEYKTQRAYTSQLLLHLKPIEFISYDDEFIFNHDFCYHLNYLMNYNITIKLLKTSEMTFEKCDLLVLNFDCNYSDISNVLTSKYILLFTKDDININGYEEIRRNEVYMDKMVLLKKI